MLKRYCRRTWLAALIVGFLGIAPLTAQGAVYFDDGGGTIGSGTRSDSVNCGGMLGSGTCSIGFLDDSGYFGSGH